MNRISLMGMEVDRVDEREAVETILDARERDRGGIVLTPNLEHLNSFRTDPEDMMRKVEERMHLAPLRPYTITP